jgi:hypothetical protein
MFEKPQDLFSHAYVNHAHDDILELWLESGIFGIALMGAFAAWFVSRAIRIWRYAAVGVNEFDRSLARAATIAVALIVIHSFLDYPLRTGAMTALLAFACGLMVETLGVDDRAKQRSVRASFDTTAPDATPRAMAVSPAASPPAIAAEEEPAPSYQPPRQRPARWGDDVEWPEAWRKGGAGQAAGPKKTPARMPSTPPDDDKT